MVSLLIFVISIIVGRVISSYYFSLRHSLDANYYHYLSGIPIIGIILAIAYYKKFGRMKRAEKPGISGQKSRQEEVIDEYHI